MISKNKLEEQSRAKEKALEEELIEIADRVRSSTSKALIIIGSLSLGYLLYKAIFESKTSTKNSSKINSKSPSRFSKFSKSISKELVVLLLSVAKKKIQDYIDSKDEDTARNTVQKKGE